MLPKRNTAELGVMFGMLLVSDKNGLHNASKGTARFDPTWQLGARAAFFPEKIFGVEAEWAHGFGNVSSCVHECAPTAPASGNANFDVVRGHLIGQLPSSRAVPFALLGGGVIHEKSNTTGADDDFLLEAGVGLKVMVTKLIVPRLDLRANVTEKRGGGFFDGISVHPEILLGLSFKLGG